MLTFDHVLPLARHRLAMGQSAQDVQEALVRFLEVDPGLATLVVRAAQILNDDQAVSEADSRVAPRSTSVSAPPP